MNPDRRPLPLRVESVEWIPSSPDEIEVRIYGAWNGSTVPPEVSLVIGDEVFAPLADPPAPGLAPAWTAAYLVPVDARAALEEGNAAVAGPDFALPLPAARPGAMDRPPGTVVDPAVLAERRARRAEIAEESATRRAASAEQTVETLRAQLAHLEERAARAGADRDTLAARVADAERRLRLAEQREEAERRRRAELEDEVASARRGTESELEDLRARLAGAEELVEVLERELEHTRRRAEDASRIAEAESAARAAAEETAARATAETETLRAETESLRAAAAEAESVRAEAAEARSLRAEAESLRAAAADAEIVRAEADALRAESAALRARVLETERLRAETESLRAEADALRRRAAEAEARASRSSYAGATPREVEALRAEADSLRARAAEADALRSEVEALRARAAVADDLRARIAELERRLVAQPLSSETETLRARAAELDRRLAAERAARVAAEERLATAAEQSRSEHERALIAQVAALEAELARRAAVQERVQEAIALIRVELGQVRAQVEGAEPARAAEAGAIADLRAELVELEDRSRGLEAAIRARGVELEAARSELARARSEAAAARAEAERQREALAGAERSATEARRLATQLAERLAEEQAARAAAEELLARQHAAPPAAGDVPSTGDPALDTLIAGLRAQVAAAREQLERWGGAEGTVEDAAEEAQPPAATSEPPLTELPALDEPLPPKTPPHLEEDETRRRLQAIAAELRAAVPDPGSTEARDVIGDLQRAAERLRAAAEQELERLERPGAEEARQIDPAGRAAPAAESVGEAAAAAEVPPGLAGSPASARGGGAFEDLGARRTTPAGEEGPWLRVGMERLAVREPATAARLLAALLPVQALVVDDLAYDLTAPSVGTLRVVLSHGKARVEPRAAPGPRQDVDLLVEGPLDVLAPLAAGGAGWRLKGASVRGSRLRLRRLLKARRDPVDLVELGRAGAPVHPGLLLSALAAAVDPEWTRGERFGVAYEIGGDGTWTVRAANGAPLSVGHVAPGGIAGGAGAAAPAPGGLAEGEAGVDATIVVSAPAFMPLIAGYQPPPGQTAAVAGDRRVVEVLHEWFDRARGVTPE
ncbi:MAG TPA: hypothetical protein VF529_21305 [Solirubrobacteraceae bacterium]